MPGLPDLHPASEGQQLAFPPVSRDHVQNCSYDVWYPKYRRFCINSKIIPLPQSFVDYLLEDGITLADDDTTSGDLDEEWEPTVPSLNRPRAPDPDSSDDEEDEAVALPPNQRFPEIHQNIKNMIAELGGSVVPKMNWSSPKDAMFINLNTLKCIQPNDIYLLLKSSSFTSHDLAHAFDDCSAAPPSRPHQPVLVLRPYENLHVALEFRCFVKNRTLVGISQRDINHHPFLKDLRPALWAKIKTFFREKLRHTFPDPSFVFDVYIPEDSVEDDRVGRVRLVDINPWAPRTDPLLFDWQELLDMEVRHPLLGSMGSEAADSESGDITTTETEDDGEDDAEYTPDSEPEFRILTKDDPTAFNFTSPQYSAHKLPKEVVDASMMGQEAMREFAMQWRDFTEGRGEGMWENAGHSR